jgi:hypothetical protein
MGYCRQRVNVHVKLTMWVATRFLASQFAKDLARISSDGIGTPVPLNKMDTIARDVPDISVAMLRMRQTPSESRARHFHSSARALK